MMQRVKRLTTEDFGLLQDCANLEAICIHEPWSFGSFMMEVRKPGGYVLAALDEEERLIGFLTASHVLDTADLTNIAVSPQHRRRGIAGLLLTELKNLIGDSSIFLEVRESNAPAIALYQKHGFVQVGLRRNFYRNPEEHALLMKSEPM